MGMRDDREDGDKNESREDEEKERRIEDKDRNKQKPTGGFSEFSE